LILPPSAKLPNPLQKTADKVAEIVAAKPSPTETIPPEIRDGMRQIKLNPAFQGSTKEKAHYEEVCREAWAIVQLIKAHLPPALPLQPEQEAPPACRSIGPQTSPDIEVELFGLPLQRISVPPEILSKLSEIELPPEVQGSAEEKARFLEDRKEAWVNVQLIKSRLPAPALPSQPEQKAPTPCKSINSQNSPDIDIVPLALPPQLTHEILYERAKLGLPPEVQGSDEEKAQFAQAYKKAWLTVHRIIRPLPKPPPHQQKRAPLVTPPSGWMRPQGNTPTIKPLAIY
jgi:hypothetical protein